MAYILLAVGLSWAWWVPMAVTGIHVSPGRGWPTHLPGLLGPAIAAFVVTAVWDGRPGVRDLVTRVLRWRVRWQWWAVLAITLLVLALPLATASAIPADYLEFSGAAPLGLLTILFVLVVNGFGEETGWRGLLADQLLARHSLAVTSLAVGVIWAIWHLPLFFIIDTFRDLGVGGTVGWVFGLIAGSTFLTWLYRGSGRSILLVALWHIAFNFATATAAATGFVAATVSTLVIIAAVVIVAFPSAWRRPHKHRPRRTRVAKLRPAPSREAG